MQEAAVGIHFSRAFDEFAEGKLAERVHEALIKAHRSETLIGHIRRDGTASVARGEVQRPRRQDRRERLQAAPELGHAPLIDHNPRQGEKIEFAPAQAIRYHERTAAERSNARLKDEFGGNSVMVKGNDKVMSHRMFGILSLSADPLMRLRH